MRWAGHIACVGIERDAYRVMVGKPDGNGPLGRSRHRLDNNIKNDLEEVGREAWIGLLWLRIGTNGWCLCT
jgi:hypothetical protein